MTGQADALVAGPGRQACKLCLIDIGPENKYGPRYCAHCRVIWESRNGRRPQYNRLIDANQWARRRRAALAAAGVEMPTLNTRMR